MRAIPAEAIKSAKGLEVFGNITREIASKQQDNDATPLTKYSQVAALWSSNREVSPRKMIRNSKAAKAKKTTPTMRENTLAIILATFSIRNSFL